jgi:hypothetical protein
MIWQTVRFDADIRRFTSCWNFAETEFSTAAKDFGAGMAGILCPH